MDDGLPKAKKVVLDSDGLPPGIDETAARYRAMLSILDDVEIARREAVTEGAKLETVVQELSDGVVLLGADGEVLVANRRALEILSIPDRGPCTREHIDGIAWLDIGGVLGRVRRDSALDEQVTAGREPYQVVRVRAREVLRDGALLGTLLLFSDVTRERELDRAKNELITNVSHELRTPLSAIKVVLSNIGVGVFGEQSDKMHDAVRMLDRNVDRLAVLIDELLEAARISERGVVLAMAAVDVDRLCEDLQTTYAPQMADRRLGFEIRCTPPPVPLVADAKRVYQVISNFLNNAMKFTPEGGRVTVEIRPEGEDYLFSVADTGRGIDPHEHAQIFDRFHQVGREYGPGARGVGLGLHISREIVEAHGGRIWVESDIGRGATFFFTLPAVRR